VRTAILSYPFANKVSSSGGLEGYRKEGGGLAGVADDRVIFAINSNDSGYRLVRGLEE